MCWSVVVEILWLVLFGMVLGLLGLVVFVCGLWSMFYEVLVVDLFVYGMVVVLLLMLVVFVVYLLV